MYMGLFFKTFHSTINQLQSLVFFTTLSLFCFFLSYQFLNSRIVITILFFACNSFRCHLFWKKKHWATVFTSLIFTFYKAPSLWNPYNFLEYQNMKVCVVFSLFCSQTLPKTKFGKVHVQSNICGHLKNIWV